MAIDPNTTDTVTIPQLDPLTLALETFLVGANADGKMGNFTAQGLAEFLTPYISSFGASPFVTNTGSPLPYPIDKQTAITFVGIGTFDQVTGDDIVTTEELNVLFWSSPDGITGTWVIGVEVPIILDGYATTDDLFDGLNLTKEFDATAFIPSDKSTITFNGANIPSTISYIDRTVLHLGDTLSKVFIEGVAGASAVKISFITITAAVATIIYEIDKTIVEGVQSFTIADLAVPDSVFLNDNLQVAISSPAASGLKVFNSVTGDTYLVNRSTLAVTGPADIITPLWLEVSYADGTPYALQSYPDTKTKVDNTYSVSEPEALVSVPSDKTATTFIANTILGNNYGFDNIFFVPGKLVNFCLKAGNTGNIFLNFMVDSTGFGNFTSVHTYTKNITTVGVNKIPVADMGLPSLVAYSKVYVFAGNVETKVPSVIKFNSNGPSVFWWRQNADLSITPQTTAAVDISFWLEVNGQPNSIIKDVNSLKNAKGEVINAKSKWDGKAGVTFGDSITAWDNTIFGTNQTEEGLLVRGYQTYMKEKLGCTIDNKGGSGWTMSTQIMTTITGYNFTGKDFCTITGGVNDQRANKAPGTVAVIGGPFDTATYAGALQTAIESVLTNYPNVKIYLITPINAYDLDLVAGGYLNWPVLHPDYINAMKAIGLLYAIPVIDLYYNSSINAVNKGTYMGDKPAVLSDIHPTNKGFKLMGEYVSGCMRVF